MIERIVFDWNGNAHCNASINSFDVGRINDAAFLGGCVGLESRIASFNPK
jgi:hypothetical protein